MAAYEICPRVWFGAAGLTYRPIEMMRFTHIVNCSGQASSTNIWTRHGREFLYLESWDTEDFPILEKHLDAVCAFIDNALTADRDAQVYIHCLMGMNRSAALAVGYRCWKQKEAAVDVIQQVRAEIGRTVLTNSGFVEQLVARF